MPPELPPSIRDRADLERLLALTTNWEELRPRSPQQPPFKLDRVRRLLAAVGDPHLGPRTVHVAGSKGKGTTVRLLDAMLRSAGPPGRRRGPVGLYTSPHLEDLSGRIAVDGAPVQEEALPRAADRVLPYVRARVGTLDAPTFFELLTALAWLVFREHGCTDVVLETGLGGRLDATNVCRPALTLITSIELEHTDVLGSTLEEVAGEKAGILKAGVPAATSALGVAWETIARRAEAVGARLSSVGREILVLEATVGPGPQTRLRLRDAEAGRETLLTLPVAGRHHGTNAALAAWAAARLGLSDEAVRRGAREVRLPGVMEPLGGDPLLVADAAHTPASARGAREALAEAWPGKPFALLLAFLEGKDVPGIARALLEDCLGVFVTTLPSPRARRPEDVGAEIRALSPCPVRAEADPARALAAARAAAGPGGVVLATGSVRMAGLARRLARHG